MAPQLERPNTLAWCSPVSLPERFTRRCSAETWPTARRPAPARWEQAEHGFPPAPDLTEAARSPAQSLQPPSSTAGPRSPPPHQVPPRRPSPSPGSAPCDYTTHPICLAPGSWPQCGAGPARGLSPRASALAPGPIPPPDGRLAAFWAGRRRSGLEAPLGGRRRVDRTAWPPSRFAALRRPRRRSARPLPQASQPRPAGPLGRRFWPWPATFLAGGSGCQNPAFWPSRAQTSQPGLQLR